MGCSYIGAVSYFTVCSTRYGVRSGMVTEYNKVTVMNTSCEYLTKSISLDLRNDIGKSERRSDSENCVQHWILDMMTCSACHMYWIDYRSMSMVT